MIPHEEEHISAEEYNKKILREIRRDDYIVGGLVVLFIAVTIVAAIGMFS